MDQMIQRDLQRPKQAARVRGSGMISSRMLDDRVPHRPMVQSKTATRMLLNAREMPASLATVPQHHAYFSLQTH